MRAGEHVVKDCMLQVANILSPDKAASFINVSLTANMMADQITELSNDIYDQLHIKVRDFSTYSLALDQGSNQNDSAGCSICKQYE